MHDPMTMVFEIKRPWPSPLFNKGGKRPFGRYWPALVTVWHVDPETDGTDDSCGWSRSKLSPAGKKVAQEIYEWEKEHPYYFTCPSRVKNPKYVYHEVLPGDCFMLVLGIITEAAWKLHRKRGPTQEHINLALRLSVHSTDNLQASFSLLGLNEYQQDRQKKEAIQCVVRHYENSLRPWWKHPRWHFWHWQIQIHPIQTFKRWAFSKCCKCGKGFAWGYSPMTDCWNGTGPMWFKSEAAVYHANCQDPTSDCVAQMAGPNKIMGDR